jgi:hypothetical protein
LAIMLLSSLNMLTVVCETQLVTCGLVAIAVLDSYPRAPFFGVNASLRFVYVGFAIVTRHSNNIEDVDYPVFEQVGY